MAQETSRREGLPGIDTAPDVYETGNGIDDDTTTSTFQTSPSGADSGGSGSDTTEEDDDDDYGVSRRRLFPQRARSRFGQQSRNVRAEGVDLSDRVDGKRKGFRIRKKAYDPDAADNETLEARVARLRREVEECKAQADEERNAAQEEEDDDDEEGGNETADDVDALSRLLAGIHLPPTASASKRGHRRKGSVFHDAPTTSSQSQPDAPPDDQTLTRITTFDARLAALESALGVSSILDDTSALSTPLLPSLTLLDQQLATLTTATSLSALEAATSKIQSLKAQADNLSSLSAEGVEEEGASTTISPDDLQKLQSLYSILPALQSLSPTVPALITRLRSLNHIHTAAAQATGDLEVVEQQQAEMDRELKMWREGLEKVEKAVEDGLESNGRNGGMVKKWVEELEVRVKTLKMRG